jgi:hypothetical protein
MAGWQIRSAGGLIKSGTILLPADFRPAAGILCLSRRLPNPMLEQAGLAQDSPDAGWTGRHDVPIQHQTSMSFQPILLMKVDGFLFPLFQPVVAWHPGIVFVDLSVPLPPIVELAAGNLLAMR